MPRIWRQNLKKGPVVHSGRQSNWKWHNKNLATYRPPTRLKKRTRLAGQILWRIQSHPSQKKRGRNVVVLSAREKLKNSSLAFRANYVVGTCSGHAKKLLKYRKEQAWAKLRSTSGGGTKRASEWKSSKRLRARNYCCPGASMNLDIYLVYIHPQNRWKGAEIRQAMQMKTLVRTNWLR